MAGNQRLSKFKYLSWNKLRRLWLLETLLSYIENIQ